MAADLLDGDGSAEGRNNDFNVLVTIKRALAEIFLDGVDFSSPFFWTLMFGEASHLPTSAHGLASYRTNQTRLRKNVVPRIDQC